MARNKGIIKLEGTIHNLSFYSSVFGDIVRKPGGPSSAQVKESPKFERLRENQKEFGNCAKAGKLIRAPLNPYIKRFDHTCVGRLTSLLTKIKALDHISVRGERSVLIGIQTPEGKGLLKGFDFNKNALLKQILKKEVKIRNGDFFIEALSTRYDLNRPSNATHVVFTGIFSNFNLQTFTHLIESAEYRFALDAPAQDITLPMPSGWQGQVASYILNVKFEQQVNGLQYPLDSAQSNSLGIIEVV